MNLTQTLLAGAIALAVATSAQAQGFPTKPIRVVVTFPAAGAPDILALGHGSETDGAPEPYMFDSFFSELITAGLPGDK